MATILITGGTGLIGKALSTALAEKGYKVVLLSRNPSEHSSRHNISHAGWDIEEQKIDENAIAGADHIIHLAGAGVADRRWTRKRKEEIANSRIRSSELLVRSLKNIGNNVQSVISASAIGWYGPDPVIPNPAPFVEEDKPAPGFLGETCLEWERSIQPVEAMGKRLVILRTGIVLSADGGALAEFRKPVRLGIAAILGNGNQMISWIHVDDLVRLYIKCLEDARMTGVYNAVAPKPVSNRELVTKLARKVKGKFYIPVHVPAFALKLVLGEMSIEVLKSTTVSCGKAHTMDFTFLYPTVEAAFAQLFSTEQTG